MELLPTTVVVGIGRNIGDLPMGDETWEAFRVAVASAVSVRGGQVVFEGTGRGIWGPDREEAFTVVATFPDDEALREELLTRMGQLGRAWDQEAVAVTFGETLFA